MVPAVKLCTFFSGDLLNTPVTPDTSILQVVEPLFSTVVAADPILTPAADPILAPAADPILEEPTADPILEPTAPVGLPVITE